MSHPTLSKLLVHCIWIVIALVLFNWGYTEGGYEGTRIQAAYTKFTFSERVLTLTDGTEKLLKRNPACYNLSPEALHQYTPFPDNLFSAIKNL